MLCSFIASLSGDTICMNIRKKLLFSVRCKLSDCIFLCVYSLLSFFDNWTHYMQTSSNFMLYLIITQWLKNVSRSIRAMEPYHKKTNAIAYKEKRYSYINPIRMYIDWTDCYYIPFKSRFRFLPTSCPLFLLYNIIIWSVLYLIIKVVNKGFWKLIQIMRIFHIYNWYCLWKFYEDFFKIKTWNKNQCIVYEQEILVLTCNGISTLANKASLSFQFSF